MDREELLRSARNLYENPGTNEALKVVLEETYPELKESEDERIRRFLVELVSNDKFNGYCGLYEEWNVLYDDVLAYLERQKEQKPISTEETELNSIAFLEQMGYTCIPPEEDESILNNIVAYKVLNIDDLEWLKSLPERFNLQPKQEWSEEDEKMLSDCIEAVGSMSIRSDVETLRGWLKSLHPQSHWKPSKEQMEALERCVDYLEGIDNEDINLMESLYNALKKLL